MDYPLQYRAVQSAILWLESVMRLRAEQSDHLHPLMPIDLTMPPAENFAGSTLAEFMSEEELIAGELLVLYLGLATELAPKALCEYAKFNPANPLLGLIPGQFEGQKLPTVQAACYILCGDSIPHLIMVRNLFSPDSTLIRKNVIRLTPPPAGGTFTGFHLLDHPRIPPPLHHRRRTQTPLLLRVPRQTHANHPRMGRPRPQR
jgi:hypothetical protein